MRNLFDILSAPRNLALLVTTASAFALAFAWTAQYGFDILPCHLCYEQRKPYILNVALGLLAFGFAKKMPKVSVALLLLSALAFLGDAGLAAFHIGVERGWWEGLTTCGGDGAIADFSKMTAEEMNAYFAHRPIVRCDVPGWTLFGLSMTTYNFMYATTLTVFTLAITLRRKKAGTTV